jgi:hypothetical protein
MEYRSNFNDKSFWIWLLGSLELSSYVLNIKNQMVVSMGVSIGSSARLPYDLQEPGEDREIVRGLMRLSERALAQLESEQDIYTVKDLQVRFRQQSWLR